MSKRPDTIVTGATGLVGRWLVPQLTRRNRQVMVLIRESTLRADAYRRWVETHGGNPQNLSFHDLEMDQDDLGLTDIDTSKLRDIYHLAARYEFGLTRNEARKTAVLGSLRLLDWCQSVPKLRRFVFITGYLAATHAETIRQAPVAYQQKLIDKQYRKCGAYEASKVEENILVQRKAKQLGIPYTIVNPSAISGDSQTGETTQFIGPAELVRDIYFGKLPALVGGADIFVPLVAVDYVAKFMAAIPDYSEAEGRSYWLLDQTTPNLPGLVAQIGRYLGVDYPKISIPKIVVRALPRALSGADPEALVFLTNLRYDTKSADKLAKKMGIAQPGFSPSLENWIDFLVLRAAS